MNHSWYYYKPGLAGEQLMGPIPEKKLIDMITCGRLKPNTKLASQTVTNGQWTVMETIDRFLDAWEDGKDFRSLEKQRRKVEAREAKQQAKKERDAIEKLQRQKALEHPSIIERFSIAGVGALFQGLGMVSVGCAVAMIDSIPLALVLGGVGGWLLMFGYRQSHWLECSHCGTRAANRQIVICPSCHGRFVSE